MPLNDEPDPRPQSVPPATRRAAFAALVAAQDAGATVAASRAEVAREYGLTPEQVRAVEREGMERQWPPLGDAEGQARLAAVRMVEKAVELLRLFRRPLARPLLPAVAAAGSRITDGPTP